ncbi:hypothetical protein ACN265_09050 [Micromonospora sp. WMMD730]|uniref:hypothetical protein n=1 Tax=Micromonospora sp. WMMD730 TaxID=3404128 RepID=UPI003B93AD95
MTTNQPDPPRDEPDSLSSLLRETFDLVDEVVAGITDEEIDDRLRIMLRSAGYTDVDAPDAEQPLSVPAQPKDQHADPRGVSAGSGSITELTLDEVAALATKAHAGQLEMYGGPYDGHLRTVAKAMRPFGRHMEMAGWLHDILEMTDWTADKLRRAGVPGPVVSIVERVTPMPDSDYLDSIRRIAQDPEARLVKIADNADSIYPERTAVHQDADKLLAEFEQARPILWSAASREDVIDIVSRVNPPLLRHLPAA